MPAAYDGLPRHVQALRARLRNIARGRNVVRLERTIANVAVAQMLPNGVVKGGTAMRLRAGLDGVRFSADLDTARPAGVAPEEYVAELVAALTTGWSGFTGTVKERPPAAPAKVPAGYVMRPYDIKLAYRSSAFLTVELELGHDELGSAAVPAVRPVASSIIELFSELGLEAPQAVGLLASSFQIVQKLHACTTINAAGGNDRAHDLIDIQLLYDLDPPEPAELAAVGSRLFMYRQQGAWPPIITARDGWEARYSAAAEGLDVRDLDEAIAWLNERIVEADEALRRSGN